MLHRVENSATIVVLLVSNDDSKNLLILNNSELKFGEQNENYLPESYIIRKN